MKAFVYSLVIALSFGFFMAEVSTTKLTVYVSDC